MPQSRGEQKDDAKGSEAGPQVGTRYSADEIHENVVTAAEDEMERGALELAFSGVASGLVIGFTFLATAFLTSKVSLANRPVAAGIAYPLGFIFVVLSRHQLFTENTLEPVVPVLERRTLRSLRKLVRLWSIVLPANLIGAAVFALAVAWTPVLEPSLNGALLDAARTATSGSALLVFYKAIWAGWLVATMAWLIASTRDTTAQIALVWLTTAPIAALGFRHSIAGAVDVFYRIWSSDVGFGTGILGFEIPALAGNIVGGVVLVALVNHGQVGKGS